MIIAKTNVDGMGRRVGSSGCVHVSVFCVCVCGGGTPHNRHSMGNGIIPICDITKYLS